VRIINSVNDGTESIDEKGIESLRKIFNVYVFQILGLRDVSKDSKSDDLAGELMNIIISLRGEARLRKDFAASDRIRDELKKAGIILKDTKDGVQWESI
jgi:cysteinyl-tRNA synthetase